MVDVGIDGGRAGTCMTHPSPSGRCGRLGDRAFLIGVADAAAAGRWRSSLTAALAGEAEVVCGSATVMVHATDPGVELSSRATAAARTPSRVAARALDARPLRSRRWPAPGRLVTVPCRFDGPDLDEVAALAGCRPDEVVALLTGGPLTAAVMGFSPGFAYLEGLPSPLDRVPRRLAAASGRPGRFGRHRQRPRRRLSDRVARRLAPGRAHRHLPSSRRRPLPTPCWHRATRSASPWPARATRVEPEPVVAPPWSLPPGARTVFEVVAPGLRAVVQDGGRRACRRGRRPRRPARPIRCRSTWPTGWPATRTGAATLELTGGGTRLRCLAGAMWPWSAPRPRSASTARRSRPGSCCRWRRARCSRSVASTAGAAATCRWPAGSSGPSGSAAAPRDELTGLGAGPLAAGACCTPARGRHRSGTTSWRARPPTSTVVAGRAARRPRPACRAVRRRRADAPRGGGLRGAGGIEPGRSPPAGRGDGCAAARGAGEGERSTPRAW